MPKRSNLAIELPKTGSTGPAFIALSSGANVIPSLAGLGVAAAAAVFSFFGIGLGLIEHPGGAIRSNASPMTFAATLAKLPATARAETQKSHMPDGVETLPRQNLAVPQLALPKGISTSSQPGKPPKALAPPIPLQGSQLAAAEPAPAIDERPATRAFPSSLNPPTHQKAKDAAALSTAVSETQAAPRAPGNGTTLVDGGTSSIPSSADMKTFLARGDAALRAGDPVSARVFYRRVYEAGESRGALGMAASYDPLILQRFHIAAQQSNLTEALAWYIRARKVAGSGTGGFP